MKSAKLFIFVILAIVLMSNSGCDENSESKDRDVVNKQQEHYAKVQPIPFYDFSIPRDVLEQIYNVVTQEARMTYTIIESVTGVTRFHGPSISYGIPADVSLTNPLQPAYDRSLSDGEVIEQAEPNGLFSSKNTDGTWVLFVDSNGDITPIYTEHKVTTFPFAVVKNELGEWVRADKKRASMVVHFNGIEAVAK